MLLAGTAVVRIVRNWRRKFLLLGRIAFPGVHTRVLFDTFWGEPQGRFNLILEPLTTIKTFPLLQLRT